MDGATGAVEDSLGVDESLGVEESLGVDEPLGVDESLGVELDGVDVSEAGVTVSLASAAGDVLIPIPTLSANATSRPINFLPCAPP